MINCQKFNFLLFLTINSVTTGVRELNVTSQISLVTHDAKGEMREIWGKLDLAVLFTPSTPNRQNRNQVRWNTCAGVRRSTPSSKVV